MNALPHCARECENGRVFSGTIEELLSTLVLKFRKSASTGFQVLFIRLAIFSLLKVVLISVRETGIEGANNCLFLT